MNKILIGTGVLIVAVLIGYTSTTAILNNDSSLAAVNKAKTTKTTQKKEIPQNTVIQKIKGLLQNTFTPTGGFVTTNTPVLSQDSDKINCELLSKNMADQLKKLEEAIKELSKDPTNKEKIKAVAAAVEAVQRIDAGATNTNCDIGFPVGTPVACQSLWQRWYQAQVDMSEVAKEVTEKVSTLADLAAAQSKVATAKKNYDTCIAKFTKTN